MSILEPEHKDAEVAEQLRRLASAAVTEQGTSDSAVLAAGMLLILRRLDEQRHERQRRFSPFSSESSS